jgi:hypothetical protein
LPGRIGRHFPRQTSTVIENCSKLRSHYPAGDGSIAIFASIFREQPPGQMALRQQQPIVAGVLNQTAPGFHQPLLQAGERPVGDRCRQRQPPPQIAQVVGNYAQPQPHLIGPEAVAAKPRHRERLLAFLDPVPFQGCPVGFVLS